MSVKFIMITQYPFDIKRFKNEEDLISYIRLIAIDNDDAEIYEVSNRRAITTERKLV